VPSPSLSQHEQATLEHVEQLVSNLRSLTTRKDHAAALATSEEGRTAGLTASLRRTTRKPRRQVHLDGESTPFEILRRCPLASPPPNIEAMSSVGVTSRFGINPFSVVAFVIAVLAWSDVFHLSETHIIIATIPGTALGALGVRWAISKAQRQWFAWTAFGLNFVPTFIGFILLLAYLVGFRPEEGQGRL
jgi:hypothetical protein